ncbi:hypothetical protein RJ53_11060 [Methanocalculus chunghsingensis]|uniref:DUF4013 domain-containing protein n=1 Tax=Methanocalculus chunghsingensis TaxID=156457 RepID=A0A8J8B5M6_9EURY|nr:hypothetical protein [Methanocalculus chunghsingensis]
MQIITLITDAGVYTKELFLEKKTRLPLFIILLYFIYPLFLGYIVEIYRGKISWQSDNPFAFATGAKTLGRLFYDGIRAFIIQILYATPIALVLGPIVVTIIFGESDPIDTVGSGIFGLPDGAIIFIGVLAGLFIFLYTILIAFSLPIGLARFAHTGKMLDAFRFLSIFRHITRIGWISYLLSIGILLLIIGGTEYLLMQIPQIGWILVIIATPILVVFAARYSALIYESVPEE